VLAVAAVAAGDTLLCLSDAAAGEDRAAVPALLALSAVHTRLVEMGLRMRCSLLVLSDEPRDTHGIACLLGYGATRSARGWRSRPSRTWPRTTRSEATAPRRTRRSGGCSAGLEEGVLKVMSKMGIS
jgi:glutamate synthase (NADPH/NADH) large chain